MTTENKIREILIYSFLICIVSSGMISPAIGAIFAADGTEISSANLSIRVNEEPSLLSGHLPHGKLVFFTNSHCSACEGAKEYLDTYIQDHPDFFLEIHDIFNSTENRTIFESYKAKYNRRFLSTPSLMIGNLTLEGTQDIRTHTSELMTLQDKFGTEPGFFSGLFTPLSVSGTSSTDIPLLLIIGAGLLDGINPCAFAVLVILLIYLMAQKSRKAMLSAGIAYTSAVFLFYYLSGVGLFTVIQTTGATTTFSLIAGCIALSAGLLMIKDALFPKDKPTLAIPASQSGLINRVLRKATLPAAFILGILVGMFELPCTGGIYLSIISMISLKSNLEQAFVYLFIYNVAFIIPLLIILGLVTFGLPPEKVNEFRLEQRRTLRFIIGLVLTGFAIFILYEIFG
jgi:cytochrome c biogenesis protein CcdA